MSSTKPSTDKKNFKKETSEADEKVKWSTAEEAKVISVLTDQKELGNQAESSWKPIVWTAVVAALAAMFDTVPKKCQAVQIQMAACASSFQFSYYLAHPLLKLKGEYHLVKALHEQSGFGWDDMKQMVTTPPDVWDKYLEKHPKAKPFQRKAFPLYSPIEKIVEMVIATGSGAVCLASSDMGEGRSVGSEHSEGEEGDAGDEKDGRQGGIDGVESDSEGEAEVGTVLVCLGIYSD
ncbi:hypothetical protein K439DRAFT_1359301 [Ramaria rubella]|nr:hypothetical protein K439DRAFT_1359301 [Ramaria rubella]